MAQPATRRQPTSTTPSTDPGFAGYSLVSSGQAPGQHSMTPRVVRPAKKSGSVWASSPHNFGEANPSTLPLFPALHYEPLAT
jgi:hypothetical protein